MIQLKIDDDNNNINTLMVSFACFWGDQQYDFKVFGAIQSNNEVIKSISTKFQINIADIDDN
jgi:hypothetical protein